MRFFLKNIRQLQSMYIFCFCYLKCCTWLPTMYLPTLYISKKCKYSFTYDGAIHEPCGPFFGLFGPPPLPFVDHFTQQGFWNLPSLPVYMVWEWPLKYKYLWKIDQNWNWAYIIQSNHNKKIMLSSITTCNGLMYKQRKKVYALLGGWWRGFGQAKAKPT